MTNISPRSLGLGILLWGFSSFSFIVIYIFITFLFFVKKNKNPFLRCLSGICFKPPLAFIKLTRYCRDLSKFGLTPLITLRSAPQRGASEVTAMIYIYVYIYIYLFLFFFLGCLARLASALSSHHPSHAKDFTSSPGFHI